MISVSRRALAEIVIMDVVSEAMLGLVRAGDFTYIVILGVAK